MSTGPIIQSLLDTDDYKGKMGNMILRTGHAGVQVRYEHTNRHQDRVNLAQEIDVGELRENLEHVRTLTFTTAEIRWLQSLGYASDDFLKYLTLYLDLPEVNVDIGVDGHLFVDVSGRWIDAIWWEIPILSIINELYYRKHPGDPEEGRRRMRSKIERLKTRPQLTVMEFGTRRRYSREWQEEMLVMALDGMPRQVAGTSNLHLAMKYNIKAMGTIAHEVPMAYMGIYGATDRGLMDSQRHVLRDWWDTFHGPYSIALPDTVTSRWFFDNAFTPQMLRAWWGTRHDSGDPFTYGEAMIARYQAAGIDPRRKMIVFSDGLNDELIINLWDTFSERIGCGFGWGTNWTNDLGPKAISQVVKLVEAAGVPVVKLSDNTKKAIGDSAAISRAMHVFGSNGRTSEDVTY